MSWILLVVLALVPAGPAERAGTGVTPSRGPEVATSVLGQWDAARAAAWADGRPGELADLYTPGSVAGRRDRAMLRAWTARGLVVEGLTTQLLSVTTLRRTPHGWLLSVVDRVAGGTAVGAGLRQPLPADGPSHRTVLLCRVGGGWRVAAVRSGVQVRRVRARC